MATNYRGRGLRSPRRIVPGGRHTGRAGRSGGSNSGPSGLEKIGSPAAWTVPNIAALYSHPDAFVRLGATFALRAMGPSATEALQAAVLDEFPHLAEAAGEGLSQLGGQAVPLQLVIKRLDMSPALHPSRGTLWVNANAVDGEIRVAVLDTDDHRVTRPPLLVINQRP